MTQVQDAQNATDQAVNPTDGSQNGDGADDSQQPKPMPVTDNKFQSMAEKAKARMEKGAETSRHIQTRHRDVQSSDESQATDSEQGSGESEANSTSGEDTQNRTDAVDSSTQSTQDGGESQSSQASQDSQHEVTMDQAKEAMKRSQWGDEQISALPESEILKAGEKLVKREAEREKNYQEKQQIKSTLKESGLDPDNLSESLNQLLSQQQSQQAQPSGQDQNQAETQPDGQQSQTGSEQGGIKEEVRNHIRQNIQKLKDDDLLNESSENIENAVSGALDKMVDHFDTRMSQLANPAEDEQSGQEAQQGVESDDLQQIRQQYETLAMDQTMIASGLDQEYSQLKDPETRGKVRDQAKHLVESDKNGDLYYDSSGQPQWHQALRHAAYLQLGASDQSQSNPQQQKADLLDRQRAVSAGQPSPDRETNGPKTDTSQMSKMERMTLMAKARQEGKSEEDVQKLRQQLYG